MAYLQDIRIANALWEGLYALDPADLKPKLATADSVTVSPDQTRYTFHIRDGARWSNGDQVTANDFVFEWRRMLETSATTPVCTTTSAGPRPTRPPSPSTPTPR